MGSCARKEICKKGFCGGACYIHESRRRKKTVDELEGLGKGIEQVTERKLLALPREVDENTPAGFNRFAFVAVWGVSARLTSQIGGRRVASPE